MTWPVGGPQIEHHPLGAFASLVENALAIKSAAGPHVRGKAGIDRAEQALEYRSRIYFHGKRRVRILPRKAVGIGATGARIAVAHHARVLATDL
jgi:hypothetical protein